MANNQLRDLHLFAMESVLPLGMGIISNAKTGGFKKIMDVCGAEDPFLEFQIDGETAAKSIREKIDNVIPGLGHPVVSVDVTVEKNDPDVEINNKDALVSTLSRIDSQLDELRLYLSNDSKNINQE